MSKHRTENAARLAVLLSNRAAIIREASPDAELPNVFRVVASIQKAARVIHKIDERTCCEDLTCPRCQGDGIKRGADGMALGNCSGCAGAGRTTGKREARIMSGVRAQVEPFGLRVYEQGDCRGWPLYLIPDTFPAGEDASYYDQRGTGVCPE